MGALGKPIFRLQRSRDFHPVFGADVEIHHRRTAGLGVESPPSLRPDRLAHSFVRLLPRSFSGNSIVAPPRRCDSNTPQIISTVAAPS